MTELRYQARDGLRRGGVMAVLHRVEAGAAGGLLAGAAVAALFFVQGAIDLHPFSVAAALASGLFGGGGRIGGTFSQVGSVFVLPVEILAYTATHLMTFAAVGAFAAIVVNVSAFWKCLAGSVVYTSVACTGLLYVLRWFVHTPLALGVLGLPRVLLANALAGVIIGTALYLEKQSAERNIFSKPGMR